MQVIDEDGSLIVFENMETEKKEFVYAQWKNEFKKQLEEKLCSDDSFLESCYLETLSLSKVLKYSNRNVFANNLTDVSERYKNELKKLSSDNKKKMSRGSTGPGKISSDCLVSNSIEIIKNNYQKGRILVCTDSDVGLDDKIYIGHASIMSESLWNEKYETNGLEKCMFTSTPNSETASKWEGKTDGVQFEPIGYWAGNSESSAKNVKILKVRNKIWVWDWFNSHFSYPDASESEGSNAVDSVKCDEGKNYNWNFCWKWDTNSYYCSQLVWKAWSNVSNAYDLSWSLFWVSPSDLVCSEKTVEIASFKNK